MKRLLGWILLIGFPILVLALFIWLAPPRHNPLAPIDLTEPIGFGTYHKLTRAKKNRELCFTALDDAGVLYTPLDDDEAGKKCGLYNALTLNQSLFPYSASLQMTCAETAALYMWERQVAQPAALEVLGSPIASVDTYGSYSCRNIAGSKRLSEHASANAIDIAGVRLKDGRQISVKTHWKNGGPEGKFLNRLHRGGCKLFSVTLGPDYNKAHEDHFHFDMGSGSTCR